MPAYIPPVHEEAIEKKQIYNMLTQGMYYHGLEKQEQKGKCDQLKQDYKLHSQWQRAWLLAYSLNPDFHCIKLDKTLNLLETIQDTPEISPELDWLNRHEYQLLKLLQQFKRKNNSLKNQLKDTKKELQEMQSKIQALKMIETNINKKLSHE